MGQTHRTAVAAAHARPRFARSWPARHKLATALIALTALVLAGIGFPYARVGLSTAGRIHPVDREPGAGVAIVFGAGVWSGQPSPYLRYRLEGAKELYDAGKVRAILVSGTRSSASYDEPAVMRDWLVANGIPEDRIVLDGAGFSTEDTCSRARKVYGVTKGVAVTQDYHIRRAVFTCRRAGIDATGVGVPAIGGPLGQYKFREVIATINAGWGSVLQKRTPVESPPDDTIRQILAGTAPEPAGPAG